MAILIPVVVNFVLPLIIFIYERSYYEVDFIEYFFGDTSFGYTIGEYKIEIKKEKIEHIRVAKISFCC